MYEKVLAFVASLGYLKQLTVPESLVLACKIMNEIQT